MPIKGGREARKKRKEKKKKREKKQRYVLSKRERVCNTMEMKKFRVVISKWRILYQAEGSRVDFFLDYGESISKWSHSPGTTKHFKRIYPCGST